VHALGGVYATGWVVAARCAYDFVNAALEARCRDGEFGSWRHHEIVRLIFVLGWWVSYFLDEAGRGTARVIARCIESLVVVARELAVSSDRDRVLSNVVLRLKARLAARENAEKNHDMQEKCRVDIDWVGWGTTSFWRRYLGWCDASTT
jgi:hypothetical protein